MTQQTSTFGPMFGAPGASATPTLFTPTGTTNPSGGGTQSIFGAPSATPSQPGTTSLFGGTAPATTNPSTGIGISFATSSAPSSTSSAPLTSGSSSSLFQNPAVGTSSISRLDQIFKHNQQISKDIAEELKQLSEGISEYSTMNIKNTIEICFEQLSTLSHTLKADMEIISSLRQDVIKQQNNLDQAARLYRIAREQRTADIPLEYYQRMIPSMFFRELVNSFELRMQQYRLLIQEIERYLTATQSRGFSPAVLHEIMGNHHQFFLAIAAHSARLHEKTVDLCQQYLTFLRKYMNSDENPFKKEKKKKEKPPRTVPAQQTYGRAAPGQATQPFGAPAQTSSLFGTAPTSSSGSMFGTAPVTQSTGGSLFGTAPATGGSMFGIAPATSAPAQTPSLFGTAPIGSSGSMFGTAPVTQSTGGSLFGTAPATGGSMFGTQQSQGSIFQSSGSFGPGFGAQDTMKRPADGGTGRITKKK